MATKKARKKELEFTAVKVRASKLAAVAAAVALSTAIPCSSC